MWKSPLLSLYYQASLPYRRICNARAAAAGRAPVMVLFYHRVADDGLAPEWTCPWEAFRRQMEWLEAHFDMVTLAEAQRRIRGINDRPAVSVTFDDGYSDNCRQALPYLVERQIPCTYFVALHNVLTGEPFSHDAARGEPLPPNTIDELRRLAAAGVEIGAHTRTHADLGRMHDPGQLQDEVVVAARELQATVEADIRFFAFPYGQHANLNAAAFALARAAGFEAVCSAYGGFNFPGDDAFHLQRIHADPDMLRLKNWLTVDPRKRRVKRYDPDLAPAAWLPLGAVP